MKEKAGSLEDLIPKAHRECRMGYIHVFNAFDPTDELWVAARCSRPWCLPCEGLRVWRLQRKIKHYLDHHNPRFLWIVTRSVRNTSVLRAAFNTLRDAQIRFSNQVQVGRSEDHPLRLAQCWIATTEVKFSSEGFNVHEHMIWGTKRRYLDFGLFHKYWDRAAGFRGAHINVVPLNDPRHAANYVAKYLSKGIWGGLSVGRAYLVRDALRGRNRIQSKRGTLPPKEPTGFCFCCVSLWETSCDGEGERPWANQDYPRKGSV